MTYIIQWGGHVPATSTKAGRAQDLCQFESEEALEIARNLPSIMPDYGPVLQARIHNCYEKYALAYQQNLKDCGTKLRQTELEKRRCSHTTNIKGTHQCCGQICYRITFFCYHITFFSKSNISLAS